ncbi:FG-GAP-like repeat-containing protein [Streptomyces sp.]|uniref:FG-GAP-like repeat-containing protein n=1 Tax=Streptomyces sp. TaxID=1931 RepID=UPI002D77A9AC|nr:FG-GAP-like repeat-containing protein [Streptomyces sp.]
MSGRVLRRTVLGITVSATLVAGIGPSAGAAEPMPGSLVIPAEQQLDVEASLLVGAGLDGFLRGTPSSGYFWISYADGSATAVQRQPLETAYGTGTNAVAFRGPLAAAGTKVRLRDMATSAEQTVVIPPNQSFVAAMGTTVVTKEVSSSQVVAWHLLASENGQTVDRVVTGFPEGAQLPNAAFASNGLGVVATYSLGGKPYVVWIDHSGEARPTHLEDFSTGAGRAVLSGDRFAYWTSAGKVVVWNVADFAKPVREFELAYDATGRPLGVIGDDFLTAPDANSVNKNDTVHEVWAVPMSGGPRRLLFDKATAAPLAGPDGRLLLVQAGEGLRRSVQAIQKGEGGTLEVRKVADVPTVPERPLVVAAAQGQLSTYEDLPFSSGRVRGIDLTTTLPLTAGPRTDRGYDPAYYSCYALDCRALLPTGDGRLVYSMVSRDRSAIHVVGRGENLPGREIVLDRNPNPNAEPMEVSGRYVAYYSNSRDLSSADLQLQVLSLDTGKPVLSRGGDFGQSMALWGSTLWIEGATPGLVEATDVRTGKPIGSVDVGSCDLTDLQAVGGRLYWECDVSRTAGVYDTAAKRNLSVPFVHGGAGTKRLADGYLGSVDSSTVNVIDVRGTSAVSRAVGEVPENRYAGYGWAVDRFGGHLTRVDEAGSLHVAPTGLPASGLSAIDADVPGTGNVSGGTGNWTARWWLSKPSVSWQFTVKNRITGVTVRTLSGGLSRGIITATWDGKNEAGELLPNGPYTWTVTAKPADGQGADLMRSGTMTLTGGVAVRRDHAGATGMPDGVGDLLSLSTSGTFAFGHGTGTGAFSGTTSGSGWPTSAVAVPFGDLNGDRCNDVLVRMPSGELRAYKPSCGKALTPTTSYTSLGTVWNQFNVLTSPGDVTGDGKPDLVARQAATGDIYLYADNGAGGLRARGRIGTKWTAYGAVFGAGDLNGDGAGDLLAVDKAHALWRYDGTAAGTFKPRVAVFANNWGVGRNAFVGVGDITGDGKADLVSRNAAGDLLRNSGSGKGSFGSTVRIGTGWQGYKGLF